MATTVLVTGDLKDRIDALETEKTALSSDLAETEAKLRNLEIKRDDANEQIAKGMESPATASKLTREWEGLTAKAAGLKALLTKNEQQLAPLWAKLRCAEQEERDAAEVRTVTDLAQQAIDALTRIQAAFSGTANDFQIVAGVRRKLELEAQNGVFAPMQGRPIPAKSQAANQALDQLNERQKKIIDATGWAPAR